MHRDSESLSPQDNQLWESNTYFSLFLDLQQFHYYASSRIHHGSLVLNRQNIDLFISTKALLLASVLTYRSRRFLLCDMTPVFWKDITYINFIPEDGCHLFQAFAWRKEKFDTTQAGGRAFRKRSYGKKWGRHLWSRGKGVLLWQNRPGWGLWIRYNTSMSCSAWRRGMPVRTRRSSTNSSMSRQMCRSRVFLWGKPGEKIVV